jgi:pantothenate kinase type III
MRTSDAGSGRRAVKVVAINVGNSTISAALLEGHAGVERRSIDSRDAAAMNAAAADLGGLGAGDLPVAAASVNAPLLAELEKRLPFPVTLAGREFPVPIVNLCRRPERTGVDRLLSGYAAGILYGRPALVVDFGTALTFNVVDGDGAFCGGAIVPGVNLAAGALESGCFQLPRIDVSVAPPGVGRDTEEAIASGLLNGYVGLVDHMVRTLQERAGLQCRVVATGGEAGLIAPRTATIEQIDPDLTLRGISLAYETAVSA